MENNSEILEDQEQNKVDHQNQREYEGIAHYKIGFKRQYRHNRSIQDKHTALQIQLNKWRLGSVISDE